MGLGEGLGVGVALGVGDGVAIGVGVGEGVGAGAVFELMLPQPARKATIRRPSRKPLRTETGVFIHFSTQGKVVDAG